METDFFLARARCSIALPLLIAPLLLLAVSTGCALNRSAWYPPSAAPTTGILVNSPDYLAAAEAEYAAGAAAEVDRQSGLHRSLFRRCRSNLAVSCGDRGDARRSGQRTVSLVVSNA